MPRGVKNPEKKLVVKGRGSWAHNPPLVFETTMGYLWVGKLHDDGTEEYVFSMSPSQQRALGHFLLDGEAPIPKRVRR